MEECKIERKPNPRYAANVLSRLFFWWLLPYLRNSQTLCDNLDKIPQPIKEDGSQVLGDEMAKIWKKEIVKADFESRHPSLLRTLFRMFWRRFLAGFLVIGIEDLVIRTVQPLCVGYLVRYFEGDPDINSTYAYIVVVFLLVSGIGLTITHHVGFHLNYVIGMRIRIACCSMVYRKALRLPTTTMSTGQLINLLSTDVNKFDKCLKSVPTMLLAPIQILIITVILWKFYLGPYGLVATIFLLTCLPFLIMTGVLFKNIRSAIASRSDKRIRIMNEVLSGMRVIKMYTWEQPFTQLIAAARRNEMKILRKFSALHSVSHGFYLSSPKVAILCFLLVFVLSGNEVTAEKVFVPAAYIYILKITIMYFIASGALETAEMLASVKRIQAFLLQEELKQYQVDASIMTTQSNKSKTTQQHQDHLQTPPQHTDEDELSTCYDNNAFQATKTSSEMSDLEHFSINSFDSESAEIDSSSGEFGAIASPPDVLPGKNFSKRKECSSSVAITGMSASWEKDKPAVLRDITCHVQSGDLLAVIGPIGCGKTSLLQTIIGELPPESGQVIVKGRIAYVSQDAWIFSASLKQNILFGQPYDKQKFNKVISICELSDDLHQLPHGENSLVGEKGVSLSGGQKARVALARAVYFDADVYVLDDPLSAVDVRTGRRLFQNCIMGHLRNKAKILVTHQVQHLQTADHILIMEKGQITEQGNYAKLKESKQAFASLLAAEHKEQERKRSRATSIISDVEQEQKPTAYADESNEIGSVNWRVYYKYLTTGFGNTGLLLMLILCFTAHILFTLSDWWLAHWTRNNKNSPSTKYLWIYFAQVTSLMVLLFGYSLWFHLMCSKSSENLHNQMFQTILRSPVRFFDRNPIGRILNRFSRDQGYVDSELPVLFVQTISAYLWFVGVVVLVAVVNPWALIPSSVIGVLLLIITVMFLKSSRVIKRLEGIARSPVFSHVSASYQGLATIRAFGAQDVFKFEFDSHQDVHTSAFDLFLCANRGIGILMDVLVLLYIGCAIIVFFVFREAMDAESLGLALSQIIVLSGNFQFIFRQSAETENLMTSVERILFYGQLPHEAATESKADKKPDDEWPQDGRITWKALNLSYEVDEAPVLKDLNFEIRSNEKVGIVGRTGAGKSSLVAALFRLTEPEGHIFIDGVRTADIGLHDLRRRISIIPQDPFLFKGTLRKNLDPFSEYTDDRLWEALQQADLTLAVRQLKEGLEAQVQEGGSNFSAGQKQLVCLARALLRKNKILVLDEATADVDPITDAVIQDRIRREFKDCTVLTIAHRLHTIVDSDRILVLDKGMVKEFDTPLNLLGNESGIFYRMAQNTGMESFQKLKTLVVADSSEKR